MFLSPEFFYYISGSHGRNFTYEMCSNVTECEENREEIALISPDGRNSKETWDAEVEGKRDVWVFYWISKGAAKE